MDKFLSFFSSADISMYNFQDISIQSVISLLFYGSTSVAALVMTMFKAQILSPYNTNKILYLFYRKHRGLKASLLSLLGIIIIISPVIMIPLALRKTLLVTMLVGFIPLNFRIFSKYSIIGRFMRSILSIAFTILIVYIAYIQIKSHL